EARVQADLYRERCAAYGKAPGAIVLRRDIYVGESSTEAREVLQQALGRGYRGMPANALIAGTAREVTEQFRRFAAIGYDEILVPGEIARAHRHSAAALRLIIEGKGGYTVVNGERVPMLPGDLVLTPNWSWHDHGNDTDAPMIWLDGLDTPLVRLLEAGFFEEYPDDRQEVGAAANASQWHYSMSEMRAALGRLAAGGNAGKGTVLEYRNRATGGPVMPTIGCHMQLLRPGEAT